MVIGITQRNDCNKYGNYVDSLENSYLDYLSKLGVSVIILPNSLQQITVYLEIFNFEGFILSGGNDIDPQHIKLKQLGESRIGELSISKRRDEVESKILQFAVDKKIPILGICRGMQFINFYFGGGITFNINHSKGAGDIFHVPVGGNNDGHLLFLNPELGEKNKVMVNSYHNHGLRAEDVSKELIVFAHAPDEIIEGIYHPNYPIAAIQWHPERKGSDEGFDEKLINGFVGRGLFWRER